MPPRKLYEMLFGTAKQMVDIYLFNLCRCPLGCIHSCNILHPMECRIHFRIQSRKAVVRRFRPWPTSLLVLQVRQTHRVITKFIRFKHVNFIYSRKPYSLHALLRVEPIIHNCRAVAAPCQPTSKHHRVLTWK